MSVPFIKQVCERLSSTHFICDELQGRFDGRCFRLGSQEPLDLLHRRLIEIVALAFVWFAHSLSPQKHLDIELAPYSARLAK